MSIIKRLVVLSDMHCGHFAGLTPKRWWAANVINPQYAALTRETWQQYSRLPALLGKVDAIIHNGDAIDGKGPKAGGTESSIADRLEQAEMAAEALLLWQPKQGFYLTYGTPYHSGVDEDFERAILPPLTAKGHRAEIHSHLFFNVDGIVLDVKHKVGAGALPHTRGTALARERLWNVEWSLHNNSQPLAHLLIRSHVHYYSRSESDNWVALTTPALQSAHTKYGARQCAGYIHWGVVVIDIVSSPGLDGRRFVIYPILTRLKAVECSPIIL